MVEEKDLFVLSDEIYAELTYGGNHVSIRFPAGHEGADHHDQRFFQVPCHDRLASGLCLRTGAHHQADDKRFISLRSCALPPTASMRLWRLSGTAMPMWKRCVRLTIGRRRYLLHAFEEMGLPCFEPKGAFYVFPSIQKFGMTSDEFADAAS